MEMPTFDLAELPDLEELTGVYGDTTSQKSDDPALILMTYIYEITHP